MASNEAVGGAGKANLFFSSPLSRRIVSMATCLANASIRFETGRGPGCTPGPWIRNRSQTSDLPYRRIILILSFQTLPLFYTFLERLGSPQSLLVAKPLDEVYFSSVPGLFLSPKRFRLRSVALEETRPVLFSP